MLYERRVLILNGLKLQVPGAAPVYLIDLGKRRWIPNPQVFEQLFRNWQGIIPDIDTTEIDAGEQHP